MPEIKNITTYSKAIVLNGNSGTITTFYNDEESEILASDLLGVDPVGEHIQFNYFGVEQGDGVLTVDENKVPSDLITILDDGNLVVAGENANNYSIDQLTGHLIYTEP